MGFWEQLRRKHQRPVTITSNKPSTASVLESTWPLLAPNNLSDLIKKAQLARLGITTPTLLLRATAPGDLLVRKRKEVFSVSQEATSLFCRWLDGKYFMFVDLIVSVTSTQLCRCSTKVATDNT